MFAGHLAVALVAKRAEPRVPLGAYVAASWGVDLLWPVLLLTGAERVSIDPGNTAFTALSFDSYPWSHSLLMAGVWGVLAGLLAGRLARSVRAGLLTGLVVISHWVLDFVTHRPDLPLWPGGPPAGLGLWNSVPGTMAVEGALLAVGIAAYVQATTPRDGVGRWAFVALLVFVVAIWAMQPFSPPPPSVTAVAVTGLALWLLPFWAQWADRHRTTAAMPASP